MRDFRDTRSHRPTARHAGTATESGANRKEFAMPGALTARKPGRWAAVYGFILAAATAFVLFDTFAIPRVQTAVAAPDLSSITATQAVAASADAAGASDAPAADNAVANADTSATDAGQEAADAASGLSVEVSTVQAYGSTVYIADVRAESAASLKTALAQGAFGRNLKETTSQMAQDNDAVLAINGDYYGFRDYGYVIRNGVLYRDTPAAGTDALVVYGDGTMASVSQDEVSAQELLEQGAWQVLSFGPTLVDGGQIAVDQDDEVDRAKSSNPRTAIGMVDPLHYIVVVSDGRTDESEGLSLYELAQVMQENGCTYAYNLDGGGSTTMFYEGEVVNNPTSGRNNSEREVSDIVYFG